MHYCPACRQALGTFAIEGLELDGCSGCGGVWFDGGELVRLSSVEKVQEILGAARGAAAECRECHVPIEGGAQLCQNCGRPAPRCPACQRTLVVAQVGQTKLDVCQRCWGVWFDAGELQGVVGAEVSAAAIQEAATKAVAANVPQPRRVPCSKCGAELRVSSALNSGGKVFCVKDAPSGATLASRQASSADVPVARAGKTGLMSRLSSIFK